MSVTITWKIDEMHRQSTDDLVVRVFWRVEGVDGDYRSARYNSSEFVRSDTFIPFEDLTEEIVIGWVKNVVDVHALEQGIIQDIETQKNPPFISGMPW